MKIELDVLKAVAEDIESAVDQLRGFAEIKDFRATLVTDGGVEVIVVADNNGRVEVEFTATADKGETS